MAIRKRVLCLLLATSIILLLFLTVRATTESFTVPAGEDETRLLNLTTGDHVQIRFTVTGGTTNMLNFYITDPYGNILEDFGSVGSVDYSFVCSHGGEYTLHFSNAASIDDKLVSLDYEVDHYVLGMPQMLFLTIIVLVICMVAVAVFILMSKHP
jgi:multisubunit Na+/H+ antiporter MnhC subunit